MAFSCGFFNSKGLDRTYTAENFTEYLSSIICNGILDTYGQNFKLTSASSGLKVILGTGKAWINDTISSMIPAIRSICQSIWTSPCRAMWALQFILIRQNPSAA